MAKITSGMIDSILSAIGGQNNVARCGNCMTRLRLALHDEMLADHDEIKRIAGVMGVVESDSQLQIILGPGKAQTAAEMMNAMLGSVSAASADAGSLKDIASANKKQLKEKQTSGIQRFLSKVCHHFHAFDPWLYCRGPVVGLCDPAGTGVHFG